MPRRNRNAGPDAVRIVNELGAVWSPDFAAYASGQLDISQVRCVLCRLAPCGCPPFGTDEYFALLAAVHGVRQARAGGAS